MQPAAHSNSLSFLEDPRAILESMGDAFYALDSAWRVVYANRRALAFWNATADDVFGRVVWERFPELVGTLNEDALRQARADQRTITFEAPSPVTAVHVSVTVRPSGDGVCVYWRDITERIQAEHALRRSEEHLRMAQEAGGIGTWEWDLRTDRMVWSAQMFRVLGLDPADRHDLQKLLLDCVHPDERQETEASLAAFRSRPGPLRMEVRVVWPDRTERWIVFLGRVIADAHGKPARMLGITIDGTARRSGEAAIREDAERLRLAMTAGGLATWEFNQQHQIRSWSPEAAVMHGFASDRTEISRAEWRRMVHPDDLPRVHAAFAKVLRGEGDYSIEYRIIRPDGEIRWTAVHGTLLRSSPDQPGRVIGVLQDITERKRTEERLRESEARLEMATEAAGIGIWDWNLLDNAMRFSTLAKSICGFPADATVTYETLRDVVHPEDVARVVAMAESALDPAIRATPVFEYRMLLPDARVRWVTASGQAIFAEVDGATRGVRYVGTIQDITARKAAEHALVDSESRLRIAMDAGRMAAWEQEVPSGRLSGSSALYQMFGFEEGVTPTVDEVRARYAPGELERVRAESDAAIARGGRFLEAEAAFIWPDGSMHWLMLRAEFIMRDGAVIRRVGVLIDITQRRQTEVALRVLNQELEARVRAEVTAREAAQTRAAHAERMQTLGQLAGGIAHDFNNVLQSIQGGAALIAKRSSDTAAVQRFAGMILDAATRGASTTRRLLAFARRDDLRAEAVAPAALLESMREVLAPALGAAVHLRVEAPPGLPPLFADKGQLETALVNLAINGRDAMPRGGTLVLSAAAEEVTGAQAESNPAGLVPGRFIRLAVADTGDGMDAATLARVLEPFFTTKPPGHGTGLGLPMVKGFAEQSGGAIGIESQPGRGTTVHLWLPLAEPMGLARTMSDTGEREAAGAAARVLVVDDEPLVREVVATQLEEFSYQVLVAGSGEEALALLAAGERVDALVTDLSMAGMDGLALIRAAQAQRPGLPAVLLTGYAGDGATLAMTGAISGSFTLLRKPISGEQLADRVAALMEAHRAV